jgi:threonylcarbamoyladenosine tRNA methylthiotransferase MtaB
LSGLRIWLHVLGCRSNIYDGEALSEALTAMGAEVSSSPPEDGKCAVAVVVSCSVTSTADKKCRQAVRRARRAVGESGVVAVCGCWAQGLSADEAKRLSINLLAGSRNKSALVTNAAALARALDGGGKTFDDLRNETAAPEWDCLGIFSASTARHTRVFIKVQEGCGRFCSYCAIPLLRGSPASRPIDDVVAEVRRVVEPVTGLEPVTGRTQGREVVLTGVNLGAHDSLAELILRVSEVPGLARLRLGSLEPFALDDRLLDALASSAVFCPHLHLPMQSGDDGVLARMRRGYTADGFLRLCDRARERLGDDLHVSTDVLVAFPGEDEAAFRRTLSVMERAALGRVHVFPYSPRPGATVVGDPVPRSVAAERAAEALALGARLLNRYAGAFVGRRVSVLAEKDPLRGYSRHFVSVRLANTSGVSKARVSDIIEADVTECSNGTLLAFPV